MANTLQDHVLEIIKQYTPGFAERLAEVPGLFADVLASLESPQACAHLEEAVKRWAHTHRTDPTWQQLLDLVDAMNEERKRLAAGNRPPGDPVAAGAVLADTIGRVPTPQDADADRAWAQMHIRLVLDGVAGPHHVMEQLRRYDALALAQPALAGACRAATQRLVAQQRQEVAV